MITAPAPSRYGRLGFGVSIALHVTVLAILATMVDAQRTGTLAARERALVSYPVHIEHAVSRLVVRRLHPRPLGLPKPTEPLRQATAAPRPEIARVVKHAPAPLGRPRREIPPVPVKRSRPVPDSIVTGAPPPMQRRDVHAQEAPLAAPLSPREIAATPAPEPAATSRATPAAVAQNDAVPAPIAESARSKTVAFVAPQNGGWAHNYPARLLDPVTTEQVAALAGGHYHVRVEVDENGRAVAVVFLAPVGDPQARATIEARLMTSRYLPAECSGVRCSGSVELQS